MDPQTVTSSTAFDRFLASQKAKWRAKRQASRPAAQEVVTGKPKRLRSSNSSTSSMSKSEEKVDAKCEVCATKATYGTLNTKTLVLEKKRCSAHKVVGMTMTRVWRNLYHEFCNFSISVLRSKCLTPEEEFKSFNQVSKPRMECMDCKVEYQSSIAKQTDRHQKGCGCKPKFGGSGQFCERYKEVCEGILRNSEARVLEPEATFVAGAGAKTENYTPLVECIRCNTKYTNRTIFQLFYKGKGGLPCPCKGRVYYVNAYKKMVAKADAQEVDVVTSEQEYLRGVKQKGVGGHFKCHFRCRKSECKMRDITTTEVQRFMKDDYLACECRASKLPLEQRYFQIAQAAIDAKGTLRETEIDYSVGVRTSGQHHMLKIECDHCNVVTQTTPVRKLLHQRYFKCECPEYNVPWQENVQKFLTFLGESECQLYESVEEFDAGTKEDGQFHHPIVKCLKCQQLSSTKTIRDMFHYGSIGCGCRRQLVPWSERFEEFKNVECSRHNMELVDDKATFESGAKQYGCAYTPHVRCTLPGCSSRDVYATSIHSMTGLNPSLGCGCRGGQWHNRYNEYITQRMQAAEAVLLDSEDVYKAQTKLFGYNYKPTIQCKRTNLKGEVCNTIVTNSTLATTLGGSLGCHCRTAGKTEVDVYNYLKEQLEDTNIATHIGKKIDVQGYHKPLEMDITFWRDEKLIGGIELDGPHHFSPGGFYGKSESMEELKCALRKTIQRDQIRNQHYAACEVPFLRLPYTCYSQAKTICLNFVHNKIQQSTGFSFEKADQAPYSNRFYRFHLEDHVM